MPPCFNFVLKNCTRNSENSNNVVFTISYINLQNIEQK